MSSSVSRLERMGLAPASLPADATSNAPFCTACAALSLT
jgi:hypothetical protein